MQDQAASTAIFVTITDVENQIHVDTVFFDNLLEQQMADGKLREQYQGDQFVIVAHPSFDQGRSAKVNDIFYQANMQSLIMNSLHRH